MEDRVGTCRRRRAGYFGLALADIFAMYEIGYLQSQRETRFQRERDSKLSNSYLKVGSIQYLETSGSIHMHKKECRGLPSELLCLCH